MVPFDVRGYLDRPATGPHISGVPSLVDDAPERECTMSAAVNDRPHEIVPAVHLPLTGELHPLRREFARWLATGNLITITLAVVVCATIYFWPRPAPVYDDDIKIRDGGIVIGPPPIPTGANDVGYDVPVPKVDNGQYVATPDDLFKELNDPTLRNDPDGDGGDVPGGETGPVSSGWSMPDSIVFPEPAPPPPDYNWWTEPPVIISCDAPKYPAIVRDAGIEGTVMVRVFIALNGHVKDAYVVEGPAALREAALASARTAFFKTARQGTHPVEVWVVIPITFQLNERY